VTIVESNPYQVRSTWTYPGADPARFVATFMVSVGGAPSEPEDRYVLPGSRRRASFYIRNPQDLIGATAYVDVRATCINCEESAPAFSEDITLGIAYEFKETFDDPDWDV
jgi:hypothetical protein